MNLFGGFGNGLFGHGNCGNNQQDGGNGICSLIFIIFLLQICGCGCDNNMGDMDCCDLILLLILLPCLCGGRNNYCN